MIASFESDYYHRKEWVLAVNLSAILGWLYVVYPFFFLGNAGFIVLAAVIGLPVAFGACWLICAPILGNVMRRPISWWRAAIWGAAIAAVIRFAGLIIGRLYGLWYYLDDTSSFQLGGGDLIREKDGILTLYGWWLLAQDALKFVAFGIVIALILRSVVGPGSRKIDREVAE